jgi:hypothetical protein
VARKKKSETATFVLVRVGWEEGYAEDRSFSLVETEDGRSLGLPLAVFAREESARARKAELEAEERQDLNPFLFIGGDPEYSLQQVSTLSEKKFVARLKKLFPKVALPRPGKYQERDWVGWWEKHADSQTEHQRQAVWGLLDKLEFYKILPTELE